MTADESERRNDRWLGANLDAELIKRGAPIYARNGDGRGSEFVAGKRNSAGPEQKKGQLQT